MDNNLEDLKKHWRGLSSAQGVQNPFADAPGPMSGGRMQSRRSKLMRSFRVIGIIGAAYVVLAPMLLYPMEMFPMWALALIAVYFAICSAMSWKQYADVAALDFAGMTTVDLLTQVRRIYCDFIRQTYVGIGMCVLILGMMLWYFYADPAVFLGGVCGALLGGLIGWNRNRKMRRYLREIESELQSAFA